MATTNTLTNVVPTILTRALPVLLKRMTMPRLVNGDYSTEAKEFGDTIDVEVPTAVSTQDVTPGTVPITAVGRTPAKVQIPLNNWKQNDPIHITDKQLREIDRRKNYLPSSLEEAVKGLAEDVNEDILAEYAGVYGYVGTAATTPFGTDVSDIAAARRTLKDQLCPRGNWRMVVSNGAEENVIQLSDFKDVDKAGDSSVKMDGEMGRKFGFDWYSDDQIPTHTTGAAGTWLVDQADVAIGDTGIHCDGATTTASAGDVFTVAGDTQTYVILTSGTLATTDVDITFAPAAKVAWADDAAITFKASHEVNLAFHRDAFAFATRFLDDPELEGASAHVVSKVQDPTTGLILRLQVSRQHFQWAWEFDILWGAKLVRPELACRIAG